MAPAAAGDDDEDDDAAGDDATFGDEDDAFERLLAADGDEGHDATSETDDDAAAFDDAVFSEPEPEEGDAAASAATPVAAPAAAPVAAPEADDDGGDDEEEGDAAAAASRKAQIELKIQRQGAANDRRDYLDSCGDDIEITSDKVTNNSFTVLVATVNKNDGFLFYARYDMENINGERVVGPTVRVARNGLDGIGSRVFQAAIDRMTHPDYSEDPFIGFGRGSKAPAAVVETLPAVAHHPTGQSPSGGLDCGQHTNVVGALSAVAYHPTGHSPSGGLDYGGELHVDPGFHCVDGGVCNLLVSRYPDLAQKPKIHLTDDEFKRMDFKELMPWFHNEGVHLQSRVDFGGRHARRPAIEGTQRD